MQGTFKKSIKIPQQFCGFQFRTNFIWTIRGQSLRTL